MLDIPKFIPPLILRFVFDPMFGLTLRYGTPEDDPDMPYAPGEDEFVVIERPVNRPESEAVPAGARPANIFDDPETVDCKTDVAPGCGVLSVITEKWLLNHRKRFHKI